MIYLFHGSDVEKVRTKAFEWVATARKKEPNLVYVRLAREELTNAALEDAALSGGLFVKRLLILIDDPFPVARAINEEGENAGEGDENLIEEHLDNLVASDNAIIILAPKLPAVRVKKLVASAGGKAYKYDLPAGTGVSTRGFNIALVNALASRSREKLWLEINRALRAGDAPEMLHGLLHWKARDLMDLPARLDEAPAKRADRQRKGKWSADESRALSLALITLLQDSRRKGLDLSLSLERFALSI